MEEVKGAVIGGTVSQGVFTSKMLVIDKEIPSISNIIYYNGGYEDENAAYEWKEDTSLFITNRKNKNDFTMTFDVEDSYLDENSVVVTAINQETKETMEYTLKNTPDHLLMTNKERENGTKNKSSFRFLFDKEGIWKFQISARDYAGNEAVIKEDDQKLLNKKVILDHTAPVLHVSYEKEWSNIIDNKLKDRETISGSDAECFIKEETSVLFSIQESNYTDKQEDVGIEPELTITYQRNDSEKESVTKIRDWTFRNGMAMAKADLKKEGHYKFTLTYADPSQNVLTAEKTKTNETEKCMGKSEEGTYVSPYITLDFTNPVVETSVSKSPIYTLEGRNYYQKEVTLTVRIIEENFRAEDFLLRANGDFVKKDEEEWILSEVKTKEGKKQAWVATFTWVEEDSYNISYTYLDLAKRKGTYKEGNLRKITIDKSNPKIQVTWIDKAKVQNEKYYNQTRIAHISVIEDNFDESQTDWSKMKSSNREGMTIGKWQHGGKIHSCDVTFAEDGDYTLQFSITDCAKNKTNWSGGEFVIDKTVPVLSITFDQNNARNGNYYNAPRIALLQVEEHNFRPDEINCQITASKDGHKLDPPLMGPWSGEDQHRASIPFDLDGDYTLSLRYTDLAGNKAKEVQVEGFTIDLTKPECKIRNIEDHSANADVVAPEIEYTDQNLDENQVKITLTGNKNGMVDYEKGEATTIHHGKRIQWKDFSRKEEVDDIYTLELTVTDKAGNQSSVRKRFSVNRFGSNYIFGKETESLLKKYYSCKEIPLEIKEINVDELKEKKVTVKNERNERYTLSEGSDYTVTESNNQYHWKEYIYNIHADIFKEEDQYTVTLFSKDKADNQMDNNTKEKSISFVIDKTAPTGIMTGLEEGAYKEEKHKISVGAIDNYQLKYVTLLVDETEYCTFTTDDFSDVSHTADIIIPGKEKVQKIKLKMEDQAGNIAVTEETDCLICASTWVQFVHNKTILFLMGGAGVALALLIFVALLQIPPFSRKIKQARKNTTRKKK
ncbi:MAG: Ig-like domain repeat protein [Lachnospiraceae bacterium]|nr:Ig-like domain repeat protein [Lachnospiraceae bacterium]